MSQRPQQCSGIGENSTLQCAATMTHSAMPLLTPFLLPTAFTSHTRHGQSREIMSKHGDQIMCSNHFVFLYFLFLCFNKAGEATTAISHKLERKKERLLLASCHHCVVVVYKMPSANFIISHDEVCHYSDGVITQPILYSETLYFP